MNFEKTIRTSGKYDPEDYIDTPYYQVLNKLPREIAQRHLAFIDTNGLSDDDARMYLENIVTLRNEAMTSTTISDAGLKENLGMSEKEFISQIETVVCESPSIGGGSTAQVKFFELSKRETSLQMAVKYLLTPNPKTIPAIAEHNVLQEVERIETIEKIEEQAHVDIIRVPHPYFHHQSDHIQCYGMELVTGATLRMILDNNLSEEMFIQLKDSIQGISEEKLYEQVEIFFSHMHTYCLHGDIKPGNIMLGANGKFYVIDFGQSILVNSIPEEGRDELDDKKDNEVQRTIISIRRALKKLAKTSYSSID